MFLPLLACIGPLPADSGKLANMRKKLAKGTGLPDRVHPGAPSFDSRRTMSAASKNPSGTIACVQACVPSPVQEPTERLNATCATSYPAAPTISTGTVAQSLGELCEPNWPRLRSHSGKLRRRNSKYAAG